MRWFLGGILFCIERILSFCRYHLQSLDAISGNSNAVHFTRQIRDLLFAQIRRGRGSNVVFNVPLPQAHLHYHNIRLVFDSRNIPGARAT